MGGGCEIWKVGEELKIPEPDITTLAELKKQLAEYEWGADAIKKCVWAVKFLTCHGVDEMDAVIAVDHVITATKGEYGS